jgi:hypothetical protein
VAYSASTLGGTLFVTRRGDLVYALRGRAADATRGGPRDRRSRILSAFGRARTSVSGVVFTETLVGGRASPVGQDRSPTKVNDFRGSDPARWRIGLAAYQQIGLGEVWPGITVSLHARGGHVEKLFTVRPDASADQIRVGVKGARALAVDAAGALVASTRRGDVTFTAPVAYQERAGVRRQVPVSYRLDGLQYGFAVGAYDRTLPLVIDPLLQSTFLGGGDDDIANAIAIHPTTGAVYVAGATSSFDFPVTDGSELDLGDPCGCLDAVVASLSSDLTALTHATYLGGTDADQAFGIAINPATSDVYVTGLTFSTDFPGTAGGAQEDPPSNSPINAFVARLTSTLALTRATYLGGPDGIQFANAIAVRPAAPYDVYVAGVTTSENFPGTADHLQPETGGDLDAFVATLPSDLSATGYAATYLGGSDEEEALGLAIHPTNGVYVVGGTGSSTDFPITAGANQTISGGATDGFAARIAFDLTATGYAATYLGGGDGDAAAGVAVDATTGAVFVVGTTTSVDFPVTAGAAQSELDNGNPGGSMQDAFVARFPANLGPSSGGVTYAATYLGGSDEEYGNAIALHPGTGQVYVAGGTGTSDPLTRPVVGDFPFTAGGVQPAFGGCDSDVFIARLLPGLGTVPQATYLGLEGYDEAYALAISSLTGTVYVAGETEGPFPGTAGGAQDTYGGGFADAFVSRLTSSLAGPVLSITVGHDGSLYQGQLGASFSITVGNAGDAPTDRGLGGAVIAMDGSLMTVTITLPPGLIAVALSGPGWSCTLATLTCTRSDSLAPGATYPKITLIVNVAMGSTGTVIVSATVVGGSDTTPTSASFDDVTEILAVAPAPALSTVAQALVTLVMLGTGLRVLRRRRRGAGARA